jgi:hypothetical protein
MREFVVMQEINVRRAVCGGLLSKGDERLQ